jgi:hypothetical protein
LWFVLVRRWSGSWLAGMATAVLFVGWAGHSEVTHWIATITNVQALFFVSLAVWLHDLACTRARRTSFVVLQVMAVLFVCVAVGSRESAVFVVPLAATVSMLRSDSLKSAFLRTLPIAATAAAWLCWRASQLGTWGTGTHYGWRLDRISYESCRNWLSVLLAPVHVDHVHVFWFGVLAAMHAFALLLALRQLRQVAVRRVMAVGATLFGLGYVAGIGLETLHVDVLQNVRYSYEPVLGLCVMIGIAIASLPTKLRLATLAVFVVVHAIVLDGNRQSWLRASVVYEQMHAQVVEQATKSQQPVRVLDAPGVYEGAFAYLNGYTEFLFWQQTAAPGVNLRGAVSSTQEWRAVLHELAQAAAAKRPYAASVVQWHDGNLRPFTLDAQWPNEAFPGVQVRYARIARQPAYARSQLPVHVLIMTSRPITLRVGQGEPIAVAAMEQPQAIALHARLGERSLENLELEVQADEQQRRFSLGPVEVLQR